MKKIACLFQRDFTNRKRPVLLRVITPLPSGVTPTISGPGGDVYIGGLAQDQEHSWMPVPLEGKIIPRRSSS